MKKIIVLIALFMAVKLNTKAQQDNQFTASAFLKQPTQDNTFNNMYSWSNTDPAKDADYYLRKSKNQRTVGWVTLGSGILLSGIGVLILSNDDGGSFDAYGNYQYDNNTNVGGVILALGAASGIVSIPFMIMASVNKHKARVMLKNEQTGFIVPPGVSKNIPGLSVAIQLGNRDQ
ncbi:MAG TPA: hypothetical protein VHL77_12455 [Ferruginibacter sp.]|nr:hypothetical protein [Ferruginibacter sp.]